MRLLVACPSWLFLVDSVTHEIDVVEHLRNEYYGISWDLQGNLCLSHSGLDNDNMLSVEDYVNSEVGTLTLGQRQRTGCLSTPHQLLCHEQFVIATNTGRNCLTVFRQEDLFYFHKWLNDVRWDRLGAQNKIGHHFNSVTFYDRRLYVLAHNLDRCSFILEVSWPELEVIRQIDTTALWAHNIWLRENEEIIVCNSKQGSLLEVNSNSTVWSAESDRVITRGLACAEDRVFVGISKLSGRSERHTSDGGIAILDAKTFQQIDYISLPHSGAVHEVRVLDAADACHHGLPFTGQIKGSESGKSSYLQMQKDLSNPTLQKNWTAHFGEILVDSKGQIRLENEVMNLAVMSAMQLSNSAVTVSNPRMEPGAEKQISLISRYAGPDEQNMYMATIYRDLEAHLWKNVEGVWTRLCQKSVDAGYAKLSFKVVGKSLELYLDDNLFLQAQDTDLPSAGKVGIRGTRGTVESLTIEDLS
jgi:hypothetical protein